MLRKVPIIVILGSTGTGKTKLSIELAQRFDGEIISADSMQVYKGLNIVTAKATTAEQSKAPHHLLDVVKPGKAFTVVDFRDTALPIVEKLLDKSKIPIIVGGTNYYIESLLWKVLVNPPATVMPVKRKLSDCVESSNKKYTQNELERDIQNVTDNDMSLMNSTELHSMLTKVDPIMSARLHPNNRRKIIRALEVYRDGGIPMSEIIQEQKDEPGGSCLGGPLRFEHTIILWVQCEQDILNARLDTRIDNMVAQGLLPEIRSFYDSIEEVNKTKNYTKGILQTIGFKEFIPYLEKYDTTQDDLITQFILQECKNTEQPEGFNLLNSCLDELRLVTKRYSKKQLKWIGNRFVTNTDRKVPEIYGLSTSNPNNWIKDVYLPAADVVNAYIRNEEPKLKSLTRRNNPRAGLNENVTNICEICDRHFIGEYQWNIHLKSNKHKRAASRKKKAKETIDCSIIT